MPALVSCSPMTLSCTMFASQEVDMGGPGVLFERRGLLFCLNLAIFAG